MSECLRTGKTPGDDVKGCGGSCKRGGYYCFGLTKKLIEVALVK
jgi:hypothetical protein